MQRLKTVVLTVFLIMTTAAGVQARPAPESFAPLVEKLSPAVVNISTTQKIKSVLGPQFQFPDAPPGSPLEGFRDFFERFEEFAPEVEREAFSLGSGVIVDPEGFVVTNHHVVAQAEEIHVILQDDTKLAAEVVGTDPKTDLALLKLDAGRTLPYAQFGDSDQARVGDWVFAIGNPFGLGGTVTAGIISARARDINAGPFDDFIQTDAAINRGNSGGPLFNIEGEIIGINTAIYSPSGGNVGIGFSIPAALAQPVIKQLREYGHTRRGWLGVRIQTVTEEIAESLGLKEPAGALVVEVTPGSPADEGGVQAGDIIVKFDGQKIEEMRRLPRIVAETRIGKRVDLVVLRGDERKKLQLTLGELDESEDKRADLPQWKKPGEPETKHEVVQGMEVVKLTDALRKQYRLEKEIDGLLVLNLDRHSEAAQKGVRRGAVIVRVNEQDVRSVEGLKQKITAARKEGRNFALLRVYQDGGYLFVTVPTKEKE